MADIIEKIGKYFADQEAQLRDMYAHAAASSAAAAVPGVHAKGATPTPPPRAETDASKSANRLRLDVTNAPQSLVRRRLSLPNTDVKPTAWSTGEASEATAESASIEEIPSSRSVPKTLVKKKKKKKVPKHDDRVERERLQQQRAAEGLARAQERAKRIQQEKAMQEKLQRQEREANAARLAEEMRKIEEIRRKGKQFAMRLRPQSAPSTPQERAQTELPHDDRPSSASVEPPVVSKPEATFLDGLERELYDQMKEEQALNETICATRTREQEEWTRLELQLKKTFDRNAIKQERVNSLMKSKEALAKEINDNQKEAAALRQERHKVEEKIKRERQLKQREAEKEIHARLRREESERLANEERAQSTKAAEARAKAKMRVQSRAALLKRVLHGCDIRPAANLPQNQEEEERLQDPTKNKTLDVFEAVPELAEFEEAGLVGDTISTRPSSPERVMHPPTLQASQPEKPTFAWKVPPLTMSEIHNTLRADIDQLMGND